MVIKNSDRKVTLMDNNKLLEYLEEKFAGIDSRFESLEKSLRSDMKTMEEGLRSDMKTMEEGLRSDMKTMEEGLRSDMKTMEEGLRSDMKTMEEGLRSDMKTMEKSLRSDMKTMEEGLRSDMKTMEEGLRSDMKTMEEGLRSDIERLEGKVDKNTNDIEMIKTQTAGLLEFRTEISKKVDNIHADLKREISFVLDKTVKNEKDIYDLSEQHERLRQKFEVSEAD